MPGWLGQNPGPELQLSKSSGRPRPPAVALRRDFTNNKKTLIILGPPENDLCQSSAADADRQIFEPRASGCRTSGGSCFYNFLCAADRANCAPARFCRTSSRFAAMPSCAIGSGPPHATRISPPPGSTTAVLQWLYTESTMSSGFFLRKSHLARHKTVHMNWRIALSLFTTGLEDPEHNRFGRSGTRHIQPARHGKPAPKNHSPTFAPTAFHARML